MQDYISKLSTRQKIAVGCFVVLLIIVVFIFTYNYFYSGDDQNINDVNSESIINEVEEEDESESSFKLGGGKNKVMVHVIGEVNNPGVVTLNEGARIIDAINAAGAKTEDADLSKINLAYVVEDGVQIYVPRIGEKREEYVMENAGEGIIVDSAILDSSESKEIKVNINTASADKLQTLPGVGISTAQKIIEYRTQNGKFKAPEDLKNVSGIGESKFEGLKEQITVK